VIHDVAIVNATALPIYVDVGDLVNITVIVENQGTATETFNVTVYRASAVIGTKTVQNLVAGARKVLVFTWDTTEVGEEVYSSPEYTKEYIITAEASTVPGETETWNNISWSRIEVSAPYYIEVIPKNTVDPTLMSGKNYTVAIYTTCNRTDIWGWEFTLTYNHHVLHGVEVANGDLITTDKYESARFLPGTFNNTGGKLGFTMAFLFFIPPDKPPKVSGPGTLAYVTFKVVGTGTLT